MFNEPRPKDFAEMSELIADSGHDPVDLYAAIEFNAEEGRYHGFTAEVTDEGAQPVFSTLGYASREELRKDLRALGIYSIEERI